MSGWLIYSPITYEIFEFSLETRVYWEIIWLGAKGRKEKNDERYKIPMKKYKFHSFLQVLEKRKIPSFIF